jgi:UDP-N-acetylmuramate dehydrogenase
MISVPNEETATDSNDLTNLNTAGLRSIGDAVLRLSRSEDVCDFIGSLNADERQGLNVVGELSNTTVSPRIEGTTLLFRDGSVRGVTVAGDDEYRVEIDGSCSLDDAVVVSCEMGLNGIELLSGIPGTVGAAVVQNAAAYGQAISDVFELADIYVPATGERVRVGPQEMGFRYRSTRLKISDSFTPPWIILTVWIRLRKGKPEELFYSDLVKRHSVMIRKQDSVVDRRLTVIEVRESKGLVVGGKNWTPCSGSYFMGPKVSKEQAIQVANQVRGTKFANDFLSWYRPDVSDVRLPAALVLRATGLMNGDRWGNVGLGPNHILAICNFGSATGNDVFLLGTFLEALVHARLGITLKPEVRFLGKMPASNGESEVAKWAYSPGLSEPDWALSFGVPGGEDVEEDES